MSACEAHKSGGRVSETMAKELGGLIGACRIYLALQTDYSDYQIFNLDHD